VISADDKKTLVDCSGNLKNAIAEAEQADTLYRTKIAPQKDSPPTDAQKAKAQLDIDDLHDKAKKNVATCDIANAMATAALKSVQPPPAKTSENVTGTPTGPPVPPPPYNPDLGNLLPAMYGEADNINGEKFTLSTIAGRRVGQAYQGPVVGAYGTTAFSKASYTFTSNTQVTITAIWDKSGNPIILNGPVTINMNPK
jgi:hypothetical protein